MNDFIKYALIRALKTFCQTILAMIPVTVMITEINWIEVLGTAALSAVLSVCTSVITGLPEAEGRGLLK